MLLSLLRAIKYVIFVQDNAARTGPNTSRGLAPSMSDRLDQDYKTETCLVGIAVLCWLLGVTSGK